MNKNPLIQWYKKHLVIHSIFLILSVALLIFASFIAYLFLNIFVLYEYNESIIDKKFHEEVATIPEIKVNRFNLFDGDSIVNMTISNKGNVSFWYGKDGVPRITAIGAYSVPFVCFYIDNQGNKTNYAYDLPLVLDKNTKLYEKWFPFKVNSLQDLVIQYDSIIQVLRTFPEDPEMTAFQDNWGKRFVVKNPNPDFILKIPQKTLFMKMGEFTVSLFLPTGKQYGKDIACDLYLRTKE